VFGGGLPPTTVLLDPGVDALERFLAAEDIAAEFFRRTRQEGVEDSRRSPQDDRPIAHWLHPRESGAERGLTMVNGSLPGGGRGAGGPAPRHGGHTGMQSALSTSRLS